MLINDGRVSLLRDRAFALYWHARVLAAVAFQMQAVALGWQAYALTDSAFFMGLIGLSQFLPMLVFALVVGHVADRYNRRNVARICQSLEAFFAGLLAIGTAGGWLKPSILLAIVCLIGAARAFEGPSLQALLPRLVPERLIPSAAAWTASAFQTATIVGPALGGFFYLFGATTVYAIAGVLFLGASVLLAGIPLKPSVASNPEVVSLKVLFAGILFIRRHPAILGAISLDLFAVLLGGATALLPIYARDILKTGPGGLGLLRSAPAVGALGMSIFLAYHPLRHRVGRSMLRAVGIFGIATIVFGVSTSLGVSLIALVVLGAADVVSMVVRHSLVQIHTPDIMRGRVSAVHAMFIGTSNQLGEFESGVTAALFGAVPATVMGGVATLLVVVAWAFLFPVLAQVDSLEVPTLPARGSTSTVQCS